eukprot:TRINITY_DN20962_c0_g1_i1.p2 TRINITY_DN20962_c0_g1~~TRINITY_DN20962_c0_g1_i1.p2  ORF type:complete len:139 (+),score=14.41 TRINITY_DN20962_c0_g1_i1:63-479(+)
MCIRDRYQRRVHGMGSNQGADPRMQPLPANSVLQPNTGMNRPGPPQSNDAVMGQVPSENGMNQPSIRQGGSVAGSRMGSQKNDSKNGQGNQSDMMNQGLIPASGIAGGINQPMPPPKPPASQGGRPLSGRKMIQKNAQ